MQRQDINTYTEVDVNTQSWFSQQLFADYCSLAAVSNITACQKTFKKKENLRPVSQNLKVNRLQYQFRTDA